MGRKIKLDLIEPPLGQFLSARGERRRVRRFGVFGEARLEARSRHAERGELFFHLLLEFASGFAALARERLRRIPSRAASRLDSTLERGNLLGAVFQSSKVRGGLMAPREEVLDRAGIFPL